MLSLITVISSAITIFVDTEQPIIFRNSERSFGYQVVHFGKWVIVSAPLYPEATNKSGRLYHCDPWTRSCSPIPITGSPDDDHISLGLSLTSQKKPLQLLACGPTLRRTCGQNMYVNGRCYLLDERLQMIGALPSQLPECSLQGLDIVFLIDGSSSITSFDFQTMLDFVTTVMEDFSDSNVQFALMQYSSVYKTHFNFMNFSKIRNPKLLTRGIIQQRGTATHTCNAIMKVIKELFDPRKGARENVEKLLIIITDGESRMDDTTAADSTREANRLGVQRIAIGVGNAFSHPLANDELKSIASLKSEDHVFKVTDFSALKSLHKTLEDKIFSIEGYAMQQVNWDLIAIGAPRFLHLGRVLIYRRNPNSVLWSQVATVVGEQIGSYFGSVLNSLHVNSSRSLLLVGAPTYFSSDFPGGLVYLCPVTRVMDSDVTNLTHITCTCLQTLQGDSSQVAGYFGSAISILPDLTGDDFLDLAVGAPCEDNNQGAVYIFPGQDGGFKTAYIQRVPGQEVSRKIMYFGRSVTGQVDMTGDNLPDLVVGGEGQVLILRSRPVLDISASMTFDPSEISYTDYECADHHGQGPVTTITVCFTIHIRSKEVSDVNFGQLTYNVFLDAGRTNTRAVFSSAGRSIKKTLMLHEGDNCQHHSIDLPECVEDSLTALRTALNYSVTGNPVLSEDSQTTQIREIFFEKNCGGDDECQDDLRVNLTFSK
ncbi:hypothetical protein GDO78_019758 [Eleutherodactylus coqui]|uniref:VWFA domain-containing protein n=1 Tax=Eleutherodactylus coqui TaxID=57060 RepID=A0A8J6BJ42_ELECQ|nr:hypothetical protein GDO78_019758 [Eleutherodactylus coqui]